MFESIVCHENVAGETFASFEPTDVFELGGYVVFAPTGVVADLNWLGDDFAA